MEPRAGEMGVGDVILAAFKICSDRWRTLGRLVALWLVPVYVFGILVIASVAPEPLMDLLGGKITTPAETEAALEAVSPEAWVRMGLALTIMAAIYLVAYAAATACALIVAIDHERGTERSREEVLRAARSRLPAVIWLLVLTGFFVLLGALACLLPGIWLWVSWTPAPAVLFLEDLRGRKALGRSFRLVRKRWWPTFLALILLWLSVAVLQLVGGGIPALLLPASVEANAFAYFFASGLMSMLVTMVSLSLNAAVTVVLYRDLVVRWERASLPPPTPAL